MFIVESQENTDENNSTLNKGMDIFCYIHKNSFLDEDISSGVISGI